MSTIEYDEKHWCKLTRWDGTTKWNTQWGPGRTNSAAGYQRNSTWVAPGMGGLCSAAWVHFYQHPILASLLLPMHVAPSYTKLWRISAFGTIQHDPDKSGAVKVTTIEEIPLPKITLEQRVEILRRYGAGLLGEDGLFDDDDAGDYDADGVACGLIDLLQNDAEKLSDPPDLVAIAEEVLAESEVPEAKK